jgi:hypothetical protein
MNFSLETLKELVAAKLSPDEIMDVLGWTTYELVDALEDAIREAHEDFEDAL